MAEVIELKPIRYDGFTCQCGGAWFTLQRPDGAPGVLCFDQTGSVTGYSGFPVCIDCGRTGRFGQGAS